MTPQFRHLPDGAFVCGDHASGFTAYAYPTSSHAKKALIAPLSVAVDILAVQMQWRPKFKTKELQDFDTRNWRSLNGEDI